MAYTLYEYVSVSRDGQPIEPPGSRRTGLAFDDAETISDGACYIAVVPGADMYFRLSTDGAAATSADHKLLAGVSYGFPVTRGTTTKAYGIAA